MAGFPQLREAARLYAPGDDFTPLAEVRLFERMDGSGIWDLYLADPARDPEQHVEHPSQESARAELERVYAEGRARGDWEVDRPEGY